MNAKKWIFAIFIWVSVILSINLALNDIREHNRICKCGIKEPHTISEKFKHFEDVEVFYLTLGDFVINKNMMVYTDKKGNSEIIHLTEENIFITGDNLRMVTEDEYKKRIRK